VRSTQANERWDDLYEIGRYSFSHAVHNNAFVTTDTPDDPLLDMSNGAVRDGAGEEARYVTHNT
jgi:hypothetical protein